VILFRNLFSTTYDKGKKQNYIASLYIPPASRRKLDRSCDTATGPVPNASAVPALDLPVSEYSPIKEDLKPEKLAVSPCRQVTESLDSVVEKSLRYYSGRETSKFSDKLKAEERPATAAKQATEQPESPPMVQVRVVKKYSPKWLITTHSGRRRLMIHTQLCVRKEPVIDQLLQEGILALID